MTSKIEEQNKVEKNRWLYHADPCLYCQYDRGMLRTTENNRICDICDGGPICYNCYEGKWNGPCICLRCKKDGEKLGTADTSYVARYYLPNLQPICDFCQKEFAVMICFDCRQKYCDDCKGECDLCKAPLCSPCYDYNETRCVSCDDKPLETRGKDFIFWDILNISGNLRLREYIDPSFLQTAVILE